MKGNYGNKSCPGLKPGEGGTKSEPGKDPSQKTGMTTSSAKKGKMGAGGKPGHGTMGAY